MAGAVTQRLISREEKKDSSGKPSEENDMLMSVHSGPKESRRPRELTGKRSTPDPSFLQPRVHVQKSDCPFINLLCPSRAVGQEMNGQSYSLLDLR